MSEPVVVRHAGKQVLFAPETATGQSIGTFLRRGEFYEARMLEYVRRLGLRGVYLDVGAAIGTHTLFFAEVCRARHVHSFEARGWVAALLQKNVELNELTQRVTVHNTGCSDSDGTASMSLDGETVTFPTSRIDGVIRQRVALMKIDVEGMEVPALRGAAGVLRRGRPLVLAEAVTAETCRALFQCMRDLGYRPTGRVFNDSPTFEFMPRFGPRSALLHLRLGRRASAAYADTGPHRQPRYPVPPSPSLDTLAVRVYKRLLARAPRLARLLRKLARAVGV